MIHLVVSVFIEIHLVVSVFIVIHLYAHSIRPHMIHTSLCQTNWFTSILLSMNQSNISINNVSINHINQQCVNHINQQCVNHINHNQCITVLLHKLCTSYAQAMITCCIDKFIIHSIFITFLRQKAYFCYAHSLLKHWSTEISFTHCRTIFPTSVKYFHPA